MFDKAYTSATMDYELIFWGYTFAIKKITWFAQVEKEIRHTHTHELFQQRHGSGKASQSKCVFRPLMSFRSAQ